MISDFLQILSAVDSKRQTEWENVRDGYVRTWGSNEPGLLWYLSCGHDYHPVSHCGSRENTARFGIPQVDFFLYSDHCILKETFPHWENPRYGKRGMIYEDRCTKIHRTRTIPLQFENSDFLAYFRRMLETQGPDPGHFWGRDWLRPFRILEPKTFLFTEIEVQSHIFETARYPLLFAAMDNAALRELLKMHQVLLNYICIVCDGCGFGGNYHCEMVNYKQYLPLLKPDNAYWISDHLRNAEMDGTVEFEPMMSLTRGPNWCCHPGTLYRVKYPERSGFPSGAGRVRRAAGRGR